MKYTLTYYNGYYIDCKKHYVLCASAVRNILGIAPHKIRVTACKTPHEGFKEYAVEIMPDNVRVIVNQQRLSLYPWTRQRLRKFFAKANAAEYRFEYIYVKIEVIDE